MKRKALAIFMAVLICCSMLALTAFATDNVSSPEHGNTDVDPNPPSPQTGYALSVGGIALIAVICGGVAIVSGKKAHTCA